MESGFRADAQFKRCKDLRHSSCHDSGYLDSGYSPKLESGGKYESSKSFSSEGFYGTPKENISQKHEALLSPRKNRGKDLIVGQQRDILREQPLQNSWCETPKVTKREIYLRRRLLMSKSATEGKTLDNTKSTSKSTESLLNVRSENCSNVGLGSPDDFSVGALATSTLKPEDMLLSGRKRRFLFSHVKTSTLEDVKCNMDNPPFLEDKVSVASLDENLDESIISSDHLAPDMLGTPSYSRVMHPAKDNFETPVNNNRVAANLSDSLNVLSSPSSTPTKHHQDISVSEDSGFSSLAMDKSQDSLVDHDGSFQELLLSSVGSWGKDTPIRLAEMKRRSRLERQRRLSTLREGGSQSDEGDRAVKAQAARGVPPTKRNLESKRQELCVFSPKDEIFLEVTPMRTALDKLGDLSLTPALQMVHALSRRTSRMLPEQSSLEELLRVAEEAACRTSMPLAGLIGRKMGAGKMDILTELKKRNLRHVLSSVLNHLSPEDIYRAGLVSDSWKEIIAQNKISSRRRRHYLKDLKVKQELGSAVHVPDAETRLALLSRSALRSVQAQSRTPGGSSITHTPQSATGTLTPIQPHSTSKQDTFLQVAKTLFSDECLKPCPRCQQPARCHSVKGEGICSRTDCAFRFCTGCLCAFHGSRECASLSGKRRSKKDVLPGSAQSKRNVRRL
ncbi:hypothetical protein UPYG_G00304600 [Umbra pygmaea]|uniref:ZBR-type domain-containing protein n=1 Tax=Umbra pygmaea TaxID=75934 RepID=A0ABD0W301_UMBPY